MVLPVGTPLPIRPDVAGSTLATDPVFFILHPVLLHQSIYLLIVNG